MPAAVNDPAVRDRSVGYLDQPCRRRTQPLSNIVEDGQPGVHDSRLRPSTIPKVVSVAVTATYATP